MEEKGYEADGKRTSGRGSGGVVDKLDDGLTRLNDLELTWGFDVDAVLGEGAQQAPATADAGDGTAETMPSSQEGAVDIFSVPAETAERDPRGTSASDSGQRNGEDPLAVLSGREAHELSSWERLSATGRNRTRGQNQRLEGEPAGRRPRMQHDAMDALLAAALA